MPIRAIQRREVTSGAPAIDYKQSEIEFAIKRKQEMHPYEKASEIKLRCVGK
jgi:hypothetical protein